jgi:RNA polymerase sigma factor (sigma-70 family)
VHPKFEFPRKSFYEGDFFMSATISIAKSRLDLSVNGNLKRQKDGSIGFSEGSLLVRVAAREADAFDACINQYGNLIWALAKRFSPCQTDAEDAVQDIFLEVWRKADKFDPSRSCESTFITMIARRKLIDRHRKFGRSLETTSIGNELEQADFEDAGQGLDLIDEAAKATRCLEGLQMSHQNVLRRSIHQGLSHSQIAVDLSMPLGSVKSLARRGLIQLRECMESFAATSKVRVPS